ncbi:hypothetical protein AA313_de0206350 [Arthrobotrys entomopaga]|nr:hypothetical protein AA313_de0206350 [Arthrobotrys entomopaga]
MHSGTYIIKSKANGSIIGIDSHGSKESVVTLPEGAAYQKWLLQASGGSGLFNFQIDGLQAIDNGGALRVAPKDDGEPEAWLVEPVPQQGVNVYTILREDRTKGWVGGRDEGEPLQVRPLIVVPSYPPRYPDNELFEIFPVDDETGYSF